MILTLIAWIIALPVIAVGMIFCAEMVAGLLGERARPTRDAGMPTLTVVVPAHNEALGIEKSLRALIAALPESARILVVADNCADATADLARSCGVAVSERHDPDRRGKGYALAWAQDVLASDPPDAVAVVDADCAVAPGALAALARAAVAWDRPVQAINLLRTPPCAPAMVEISSFAFLIKNHVRQCGAMALGGVAVLGGTGMAMPWHLFAEAPLASDDIVEDLALGIWAARRGHPPQLVATALVESDAAASADTLTQRSRWEHGFIATARRHAGGLMAEGVAQGNRALLWLGLHLLIPPLALFAAVMLGALAVVAALATAGASLLPLAALATVAALVVIVILAAWLRHGRQMLRVGTLFRIPLYVAWKLPIYVRLLLGKRSGWQRTRRDGEP